MRSVSKPSCQNQVQTQEVSSPDNRFFYRAVCPIFTFIPFSRQSLHFEQNQVKTLLLFFNLISQRGTGTERALCVCESEKGRCGVCQVVL